MQRDFYCVASLTTGIFIYCRHLRCLFFITQVDSAIIDFATFCRTGLDSKFVEESVIRDTASISQTLRVTDEIVQEGVNSFTYPTITTSTLSSLRLTRCICRNSTINTLHPAA